MSHNFYTAVLLILSILIIGMKTVSAEHQMSHTAILPNSDHWPPYYFKNAKGQLTGTDVELLRSVLLELGYQLKITVDIPRKRLISGANKHGYNTLLGASYTEGRAANYYFSIPYRTEKASIFFIKPSIKQVKNFKALMKSDYIGSINMAAFFGEEVEAFKNNNKDKLVHPQNSAQQLNLLLKGRVDYILGDTLHHKALIAQKKLNNISQSHYYVSQNPIHFMFLKSDFSEEFVDSFNAILERKLTASKMSTCEN